MAALIIIGSIVLFLLLVLLCPLKVTLRYGEQLSLRLRYGFLSFSLLPGKEKPEKEKKVKKPKKPKKEPATGEEKKPSILKRLKKERGLFGLLRLTKALTKLAGSTLRRFLSHVVIYHLHGDIRIGSGDAAKTAILYGKACAVLEPCLALLLPQVPAHLRRDVDLYVTPDFTAEETDIGVYVQAGIRPLFVFTTVFGALFRAIRIFLSSGKDAKARTQS
jgi:hypothetical protein